MARTSTYDLHDRIVGGNLTGLLTTWRKGGDSFEDIAHRLRSEHDVAVTASTVRRWCRDQGIAQPVPEGRAS